MNADVIKIYKAAATWSAKCASEDASPNDLAALSDWLSEDPRHAEGYAQICDALERVDRLQPKLAKLYRDVCYSSR